MYMVDRWFINPIIFCNPPKIFCIRINCNFLKTY